MAKGGVKNPASRWLFTLPGGFLTVTHSVLPSFFIKWYRATCPEFRRLHGASQHTTSWRPVIRIVDEILDNFPCTKPQSRSRQYIPNIPRHYSLVSLIKFVCFSLNFEPFFYFSSYLVYYYSVLYVLKNKFSIFLQLLYLSNYRMGRFVKYLQGQPWLFLTEMNSFRSWRCIL